MTDRKRAQDIFSAYTDKYDPDNSLIRHKITHTLRVADNCERIAKSLDMEKDSVDLAWLLGLLHDIGRFEQVRRYGTFVDSVSVDHAEFGADLLFKEGLIKDFPVENMVSEDLRLLETAIRLHNKLNLPKELDERTRCFCDLIRDADKTDIFRVISQLPFEERIGTSKGLFTEAEEAGDAVMQCVREHRCVPRDLRKTRFDGHISHCCMAFELVYPESIRITMEQGYLDRLLSVYDEDGKPLWSEKESAQLNILRKEIEKALGQSF